jgi:hypothetical protein
MATETETKEEKKASQIVEYLQAPRRKRKTFIVLAVPKDFDEHIIHILTQYCKNTFSQYSFIIARDTVELKRIFNRQIIALVIEDRFAMEDELVEIITTLKTKKKEYQVPVLFLTNDADALIRLYHKELLAFQEIDNYVPYVNLPHDQLCARLNEIINIKGGRRSRRFKVDIQVRYFDLRKSQYLQGRVTELSVHGGVFEIREESGILRSLDQFLIHLPTARHLAPEEGEYLRLGAKVRRVFMGGVSAGFSWENTTEQQFYNLTKIVIEMANSQIKRGLWDFRSKR